MSGKQIYMGLRGIDPKPLLAAIMAYWMVLGIAALILAFAAATPAAA